MTDRLAELGALQYAVENLSTAGTNPNRLGLAGYIHAAYTDYQTWAAANPGVNPNRLSARGRLFGYFYDNGGSTPPDPNAAVIALFSNSEEGFIYDFFDKEKIFQNTDGTGAVTTDGDPIGYAEDLSGNANHATAPGTGNRPLYYGYADFDGTDDRLLTPSITFPSSTHKITLVYGLRKDASGVKAQMRSDSANSQSYGFQIYHDDNADSLEIGATATGGAPLLRVASYTAPTRNVISIVFDATGTNAQTEIKPRLDGVAATTIVSVEANLTAAENFGFFQSAQTLTIGSNPGGTYPLNGRMYRMIMISRELTTEELEVAEAWVQDSFT